MPRYILKGSRSRYKGITYKRGDVIEMTATEADNILDLLTYVPTAAVTSTAAARPATPKAARKPPARTPNTRRSQGKRARLSTRKSV